MHNRCCLLVEMETRVKRRLLSLLGRFRLIMEGMKDKFRECFNSRGCLGCCTTPPLVISADEQSKGLKIQGEHLKKHSLTDDFWSPSSVDMDNSVFTSHGSISSIGTSYQTLDAHSSSGGTSNSSEFVNHGLLLWNQTRQQWIGIKSSEKPVQAQESKLSLEATYESLLGTNEPFPEPIPLREMVDFLVDVWEQEGLYD